MSQQSFTRPMNKMPVIGSRSGHNPEFFSNIIRTSTQKGEKMNMAVFAPEPARPTFHFLNKEQIYKLYLDDKEIIIKGDYGPQGETGPPGLQGEKGDSGIQGKIGPTGSTGSQGVQGDRGERGFPGGPTGPIGPMGVRGERGPPGIPLRGPQGHPGEMGHTGPAGKSFIYVLDGGSVVEKEGELNVSFLRADTLFLQHINVQDYIRSLETRISILEEFIFQNFEKK